MTTNQTPDSNSKPSREEEDAALGLKPPKKIDFNKSPRSRIAKIVGGAVVTVGMVLGGAAAWKWASEEKPEDRRAREHQEQINLNVSAYENGERGAAFVANFASYRQLDEKIKNEMLRLFARDEICQPQNNTGCSYTNGARVAVYGPADVPRYETQFRSGPAGVADTVWMNISWQPFAGVTPAYKVNLIARSEGEQLVALRDATAFFGLPEGMWDRCLGLPNNRAIEEARHNQVYSCDIFQTAGQPPQIRFHIQQSGYYPSQPGGAYTDTTVNPIIPTVPVREEPAAVPAETLEGSVAAPERRPVVELTTEQRTTLADYVAYQQQLIGQVKRALGDGRSCGVEVPCDERGRPNPSAVSEYGHPYAFTTASLMVPAQVTFQMSFDGIDRNSSDSAINVAVNFALNRQSDAPIQTYLNHKAVGIMAALRPIPAEVTAACDGTSQEVNGTTYTCTRDERSVSIRFRAPGPFQSRP